MPSNVIVAVYKTAEEAGSAFRELQAAGIPRTDIHQFDQQHPGWADDSSTTTTTGSTHQSGFWGWLFGEDTGSTTDHQVYDDVLTKGGTVLSVTAPEADHDRVITILDQFNPIDIDDHTQTAGYSTAATTGVAAAPVVGTATTGVQNPAGEQVIQLAEEELQVGKRIVETGRTRIRRYVVETPVEERVRLRTERVMIERRRRVTGDAVSPDAFTEVTTDLVEREEVPVVAKTARVGEEVVVRTEAGEREETVRDTVRREDVEVTKDAAVGTTTGVGATQTNRPL